MRDNRLSLTVLSQFPSETLKGLHLKCLGSTMNNMFKLKAENPYNLRHVSEFSRLMVKNVYHGAESISYLRQKIWEILPEKLKNIENLQHFKKKITEWKPEIWPCRLCKV